MAIDKRHIYCALLCNLVLVYKAKTPPREHADKKSLAKIQKYIKEIIVEKDYCLIAEEHRMIIKNELCTIEKAKNSCVWIDLIYPLYIIDTNVACKAALLSFALFTFKKYSIAVMLFYAFLTLEQPLLSILVAPFCKIARQFDLTTTNISLCIICRLLTGFCTTLLLQLVL